MPCRGIGEWQQLVVRCKGVVLLDPLRELERRHVVVVSLLFGYLVDRLLPCPLQQRDRMSESRALEQIELVYGFCRERMARHMVPRYVDLVDRLPRTPTEKVEKAALRRRGVTPTTWDGEAATRS